MMEFGTGKDDNPYMKWKIKAMVETTNQVYPLVNVHITIKNHHAIHGKIHELSWNMFESTRK